MKERITYHWNSIGKQVCPDCKKKNRKCKDGLIWQIFEVIDKLFIENDENENFIFDAIEFINVAIILIHDTPYYSEDEKLRNIDNLQSVIDGYKLFEKYQPDSTIIERLTLFDEINETINFGGITSNKQYKYYLDTFFSPERQIEIKPKNEIEKVEAFKHRLNDVTKNKKVLGNLFGKEWIYEKYLFDYNNSEPADHETAIDLRVVDFENFLANSHKVIKQGYNYAMKGNFNESVEITDNLDFNRFAFGMNLAKVKGLLLKESNQRNKTPQEKVQIEHLKLETFFDSISKYKSIMEILVNEKLVNPHTYIIKDENTGNKGLLVAIIKGLHGKGYYKDNVKPTNKEIVSICKNSFGLEVSIDTVKKSKANNYKLEFIPIASTIN